jgi:hypothetical protein
MAPKKSRKKVKEVPPSPEILISYLKGKGLNESDSALMLRVAADMCEAKISPTITIDAATEPNIAVLEAQNRLEIMRHTFTFQLMRSKSGAAQNLFAIFTGKVQYVKATSAEHALISLATESNCTEDLIAVQMANRWIWKYLVKLHEEDKHDRQNV